MVFQSNYSQKVGEKTLGDFNWDVALENAEDETPTACKVLKGFIFKKRGTLKRTCKQIATITDR